MQKEEHIRFQINPRLASGMMREAPGHGSFLRGMTYKTSLKDWTKLRKIKDGKTQVFVKVKGESHDTRRR